KGLNQEDKNQYYLEYNYGALFVNLRIAGTFTKRQGNHDKVFLNQAKWVIDNMLDGPYVWDRNNLNILKDYINKAN
ncbi:MAG: hypothetical protein KKA79_03000, partial [Nanoarchaeota archaeon]|nr:hypothetical protein [Nanoarchaeota archaeon]